MATFTIRVKDLIDREFDFGLTANDYPIFNELYRGTQDDVGMWQYTKQAGGFFGLNRKILDHFMYQEIGQETPDMFKHILNRTMREIMPYYNRLYVTEDMIENPFETLIMRHNSTVESETKGTVKEETETRGVNDAESRSRAVNSSFPQTMLNNSGDYATGATDSTGTTSTTADNEGTSESETDSTTSESRILDISGSQGSRAKLLAQYRETLINVDLMVLAELRPLFMMVTDVMDNQTSREGGIGYYGSAFYGFWPHF